MLNWGPNFEADEIIWSLKFKSGDIIWALMFLCPKDLISV